MMAMENSFLAFVDGDFHDALPLGTHKRLPSLCFLTESHGLTMADVNFSAASSDETTKGYLQDAVAEWSERCKRRRTLSTWGVEPSTGTAADDVKELVQDFWNWNCADDGDGDLDSLLQGSSIVSEENENALSFFESMMQSGTADEGKKGDTQGDLEVFSSTESSAMVNHSSTAEEEEEGGEKWGRRRRRKVAFPFAVLKPGGFEGDVTLAEINERILMRPKRPVKHPVGEHACMPCVRDAGGGPGLSGKAVVGLTRIHTQGRGTVTIIRTRG